MYRKIGATILCWFVRAVLSIRYRIQIRGLEAIDPFPNQQGVVFLPNHPAEIDPVILTLILWKRFKIHPVVVEQFYYLKGAHSIQKLIGAIPIPDFEGSVNSWKQKKIEKTFATVGALLQQGDNFLIYPAGRLKRSADESIGGASFVHQLIQENRDVNIVLVRTTGLWGSRFSRALTGTTPSFGHVVIEGIKIVLKNLIFLTPKRDVVIEFEVAPPDLARQPTKLDFNRFLERWYNRPQPEPLKLVSDLFWKDRFPAVSTVSEVSQDELSISPEIEADIVSHVSYLAKRNDIDRTTHLSRDLGFDSLDIAQLATYLTEKYELGEVKPGELQTVADLLKVVARAEKKREQLASPKRRWPEEKSRPPVQAPHGKTVYEAFLRSCDRMDRHVACADETLGLITYRRFKMIVLLLAHQIEKMEGGRIGVMLPSSTLTYAVIFAVILAKKVPVMLNWTVGARAIDHSLSLSGIKTVISSRRFLDNLTHGDIGSTDEMLTLVEEMVDTLSLRDKLRAFFQTHFTTADSYAQKFATLSEDDPAVILFTSGTEALPKGVPLSHKNILSNQASALSCVDFQPTDSLYSVLPPFHSFGYSVTGLFPLLAGLKAFFAPDPTHNHGMSHDIERWGLTLFCCAPTFIKGLFRVSKPEALKSLRYVVGGAEKVPDELFTFMEKVGGQMLEGYGITECGPIVTLSRPGQPRNGVGQPIPGVELTIINPESGQPLALGAEGEICIKGPNVFHGYLDNRRDPFIKLGEEQWYRSGDRGHLAPDGSLILSGRLKRFIKIGGEMISISGLEEELLKMAHERQWISSLQEGVHPLAIAVQEHESDKPHIILFTTFDVDKEMVNTALRESGYGRLIKISDVRKIAQIPVTGTGKIHYRALDEIV